VTETPSWDLRPFEEWLFEEFVPSLRTGPDAGSYAARLGEDTTALYGSADVACILYTLGQLDCTPAVAQGWLATLGSFQESQSGFFVDDRGGLTTAHNTGFAVAAMQLLQPDLRNGVLPVAPLTFAGKIADPAEAERFAATLDWHGNCYEAGEILVGHAATFFNVADTVPQQWFAWLVDYIESTKFDTANGMVGLDKPPAGDMDQIGGTLHFDFMWSALGRTLPFPEARASALLGLQRPDGLWSELNPWWLTFDSVYMLGRTIAELETGLADRVRDAVARALSAVVPRALDPAHRHADFVVPWMGAHTATGAISMFACAQRVLGADRVLTRRPLQLVLDRRPYI